MLITLCIGFNEYVARQLTTMWENDAQYVAFPELIGSKSLDCSSNQGEAQPVTEETSKLSLCRAPLCRASSVDTVVSSTRSLRGSCIFNFSLQNDNEAVALLESKYEEWDQNPESFWKTVPSFNVEYGTIAACLELGNGMHDRILRRFLCLLLHRIRHRRRKLCDAQAFARAYARSHGCEAHSSIVLILQAGARYEKIAERLGMGGLFLLGKQIGQSM